MRVPPLRRLAFRLSNIWRRKAQSDQRLNAIIHLVSYGFTRLRQANVSQDILFKINELGEAQRRLGLDR